MRENALYYPYINIPESDWLMKRLLYWDKMYSIVPYQVKHCETDLSPLMMELKEDKELFEFIMPLDYTTELESFRESFLDIAKYFVKEGKINKNNTTKIHIEKIGNLSSELLNLGVIKNLTYPWYEMDSVLANIFMKNLAIDLCTKTNLQATPLTNDIEFDSLLNDSVIKDEILNFTMPLPSGIVDLKKIREFRDRNKDTVKEYRRKIEKITLTVLNGKTLEERKDLLSSAKRDFEEDLAKLNHEISRLWMNQSKHIVVPLVGFVGGALTGGTLGAVVGLSTAVISNVYDVTKKEKNVLTYATNLQRI
ncbi:DUF6236 family protein [Arcobacter ellisii]|uniref:Kinase n=1 Tax=Arcobacter ellisii TaxID=913109 RepID=A0A347UA35_9BACT|nr:hypothetical protein [Arcobacter ellisii]AXX95713.1 hypothetical protein AELL_2071 [Arcobacter ellisii]RXI31412.1 hypothetical protein CP962_04680 [Arcobacter ellisii]